MRITRVTHLPEVLVPDAIYLVRPSPAHELMICVVDGTGENVYATKVGAMTEGEAIELIASLRNVPNGLAGIDGNRILSRQVHLSGQDSLFVSDQEEPVWDDLIAHFVVKEYTGANSPAFDVYLGNFKGPIFRSGTMNQAWTDFHIKHDIALGTVLYPHVHWLPLTNKLGRVRWGIENIVAKGHGQQAFTAPVTIYVEQNITVASKGVHFITEATTADAIPSIYIEPDTAIKARVFRDGGHARDTYKDSVHAWCCDLHYQKIRYGTIRRSPDFYGVA